MHTSSPTPVPPPASPDASPTAPAPPPAVAEGPAAPVTAQAAVPTATALSLRGLRKSFGKTEVVHGISLDVPRGSFYGIVGPNGAGKTTALSMATGLLRPSAGTAYVLGHDMWVEPQQGKARLGVLADGLRTFDRLTGRELLTYVGLVRGMEPAVVEQRTDSLLSALALGDEDGKLVVDYSAGMTKKILLASALLHAPDLLVLDEPLEAVDPVSAQVIRKILTAYVGGGGTVVLSSHVMELVEGLCSHVAIIAQGELLADGTLDEVRQGGSLVQTFIDLVGGGDIAEGSLSWLES
ncbi:ABC transporter ATP-binding protein [Brachybacterium sp. UNK5269]|uniref:ABC transporter ATP-binding protein n=1 Tax=Brachybacterium sp. UNK5269 TaxID=3408576 RepID=UPI003BAE76F6